MVRLTCLLLLLAACAPDSAGVARTAAPIVNGSEDSGDPAVVGLVAFGDQVFCTGTLVSPRVVLTAAHCLDPNQPGTVPIDQISIFFGSRIDEPGTFRAAIAGEMHPAWNLSVLDNDIAVLLLDAPAPTAPLPMSDAPFDDSYYGRAVRIVGFGVPDALTDKTGIKRQASTTVIGYGDSVFQFGSDPGQTCFGDSGGPGFLTIGGVEVLAGVTSSGDADCQAFGTDTRVDIFGAWVRAYIAANDGCAADGICTDDCIPDDPDCAGPCTICGDGLVGELCEANRDCASGLCIVAADDTRIKYCSMPCELEGSTVGCPFAPLFPAGGVQEQMICKPTNAEGEPAAVCLYDGPSPGAVGWSCTGAAECVGGLCLNGLCTRECRASGGVDCPLGFECLELEGGADAGGGGGSDAGAPAPARSVCLAAPPGESWCAVTPPGTRNSGSPLSTALLTLLIGAVALCSKLRRHGARGRNEAEADRHPHRRR